MMAKHMIAAAALASALLACTTHNGGSPDAGTGASASGSGSGTGSSGGTTPASKCALVAGTYLIQYTLVTGTQCEQIQSTTFTVDSSGRPNLTTDPSCVTTNDDTTCVTRTTCSSNANGYTDFSDTNITVSGSSASGTLHETESSSGSIVYDCTYDVYISKQ
jgi:hypothetical protein